MEIGSTTAATGSTNATTKKTASDDAGAAPSGDFQTFLKLLTTQMQNQDPLKPMDSTEFVSQLASFSSVEQQVRSNDRLQSILDVLSGGSPAGLAEWIGRDVRVAASADYAGEPVEVALTPHEGADRGVLVVKNDFGQEVARLAVEGGAETATWHGTDAGGSQAAYGRYSFALESYSGSTLLDSTPGKVFSTVREVRLEDGSPVLVVDDGTQVPLSQVGGVR
jgi:flagellar basal-body rod modification protein FlgD